MKITHGFLLMLALIFTASCKKDNTTTNEGDIVGTWELTVYDYEGTSTTTFNGDTYTSDFEGTARDITAMVEFKADGTYASSGSFTVDLEVDAGGQTVTYPVVIDDFIGTGTYSISGNQITATDTQSGNTETGTITKLDGDDFEMDFTINQSSTQQGATSTVDLDGHYVFKRQ